MEDNENQEIIAYIKFYSEIKKVILTPTFEELKKKICNVMQINEDSFNSLKLNYKDEDNDIITVSTEEDYNILLAQIKNKEVDILNIESENDGNIDINACSQSILKFHENIDKEDEEEKKNNFDIISSQQFEINKEEKKENQKNNIVIDSIQSSRIEINENKNEHQKQLNHKNNFDFQKNDNDLESPYLQNEMNDNNNLNNKNKENNLKFFNDNNINNINNINNFNNNNFNEINNNISSQTYMVFPLNCNLCSKYPIVKVLYYCPVCSIPLCEECEDKLGINHRHSILKIQTNQQFDDLNSRIKSVSKEGNNQTNNNNKNNGNNSNENQSQIMNLFNNIKDSVMSGIFGDDKKNENVNNINISNQQMIPQKMSLIQLARAQYDLNGIDDNQLQEAIKKTNGNIDEAVILLMQ